MYLGDTPCSGPGLRKCFTCTTDWYGAGRGPVIQSMVGAGRPIRNRVVDVFTPVSTFVGLANQLPEQGVRWQVVPNFVPDSLLSTAPVPRDPALPSGDYLFFAGDLSDQKGVQTLLSAYATLEPATRPPLLMVGRAATDLSALPAGAVAEEKWDHDEGGLRVRPCPRRGAPLEVARPVPDHGARGHGARRAAGHDPHGRHRRHGGRRRLGARRTSG